MRLAKGDFDARTEIRSRDELGALGRMFNSLGPQLKEHHRVSQSLALAREVEQSLLPRTYPKVEGLDIAEKSIYCDKTGADHSDRHGRHLGGPQPEGRELWKRCFAKDHPDPCK